MISLNSKGEVADFLDVDQFIPGKSAYECVAYSAGLICYSGPPGHGPTGTTLEASNLAQFWYGREEGSTDASNTNGMSLDAEYNMLQGMGLRYQPLALSLAAVKDALAKGLPVLLCGAEVGMIDLGLDGNVPYSWKPTGNHCVVVSGIDATGRNLLVHDCANVGPSGIRPGPRTYDASRLQIVSATAVLPPWQGVDMIPQGWHDDGHTLTAPNGVPVVFGFRAYVLSHNWDADDWPQRPQYYTPRLEDSNPDLGDGDQILFRKSMLGYPHNPMGAVAHLKNTVVDEYVGIEVATERANVKKYYDALKAAQAELQQAGQPADTSAQQALQAALDEALSKVADLQQQLDAEKAKEQQAKAAVEAAIAGL